MDVWLSLFFSVVLTSLVSFSIPLIICLCLLGSLNVMSHLSLIEGWANSAYENTWRFFAVFGEGSPWSGILMIASASAIVGLAFELLNFYRYETLINRRFSKSYLPSKKVVELVTKIVYQSNGRK